MKEKRSSYLNIRTKVQTSDGPGKIIKHELRENTNGGPGTWQYRVQLDDQRIRHYSHNDVIEIKNETIKQQR